MCEVDGGCLLGALCVERQRLVSTEIICELKVLKNLTINVSNVTPATNLTGQIPNLQN